MAISFWAIVHGDPDAPLLVWTGYNHVSKDHKFSRDPKDAVHFCRRIDAEAANVGLTHGVRYGEFTWDEQPCLLFLTPVFKRGTDGLPRG